MDAAGEALKILAALPLEQVRPHRLAGLFRLVREESFVPAL